jgi:hypothetical protein
MGAFRRRASGRIDRRMDRDAVESWVKRDRIAQDTKISLVPQVFAPILRPGRVPRASTSPIALETVPISDMGVGLAWTVRSGVRDQSPDRTSPPLLDRN